MKRISALSLLLATLATIIPSSIASSSPSIASLRTRNDDNQNDTVSAFVQSTVYGNITFAVTPVSETGDLHFHLEAPADNSWVGVGTGSGMMGSLMWIIYKSADEKGVTLSPRLTDAHVEPTYNKNIPCEFNDLDGSTGGSIVDQNGKQTFVVNVLCRDINNRATFKRSDTPDSAGKLSFDNNAQPFIFALGPTDRQLNDDSPEAGIRRHTTYGSFTMDLRAASVQQAMDVDQKALAQVGTWVLTNAQLVSGPDADRDWGPGIHSVAMCGSYVIIFTVGVIFLRVLEKVMWHAVMQGIGLVFIMGGVGLGLYMGREYNKSKDVKSAHQIIGLVAASLTLIQFGLGLTHHLIYRRTQRPTILGKIHLYLGPLVLGVGAGNGFLGFRFSGGSYHNIMYAIIVGVIFVGLVGILFWNAKRKRRNIKKRDNRRVQDEAYEAFKHNSSGGVRASDEDWVPLRNVPTDDPPPYEGFRAVEPRRMV